MLNSEHLSLVNKIGDKTEFTITRVHCICFSIQDGHQSGSQDISIICPLTYLITCRLIKQALHNGQHYIRGLLQELNYKILCPVLIFEQTLEVDHNGPWCMESVVGSSLKTFSTLITLHLFLHEGTLFSIDSSLHFQGILSSFS